MLEWLQDIVSNPEFSLLIDLTLCPLAFFIQRDTWPLASPQFYNL